MNPDDFRKIELLIRGILAEGVQLDWRIYLIVLFVAAIGAYVGTYLRKSAEYHAMEDNIGRITEITEEVKKQFSANIALLTANLQVITKNKINILEKEQEALDSFYTDCAKLAYERILANSSQINSQSAKGYQDFLTACLQDFKKIYISYHKVLLYLQHDLRIINIVGPMFQKIQELEKIFLVAFEQLRKLILEKTEGEIEIQYKEILRQFANDLDKASDELSKEFTKYLGAVGSYYQSFRSENSLSQ